MRVELVKSRCRFWDAEAARAAQVGRRRPPARSLRIGERAIPTFWGNERAAARIGAAAPRIKRDAAPPGPQASGAHAPSLDAKAALPHKSDGGGLRLVAYASESAPSLGGASALPRGLVRQHLVKKGRDAAPPGSQASGAHAPSLDAKAALPHKSDGGGAPSLPFGNERAAAREHLVAATQASTNTHFWVLLSGPVCASVLSRVS
jgi:hypothetical protein